MSDELTQWCRDRFGNEYRVPKGGRPRTLEPSDYDMVVGSARVVYDPKPNAKRKRPTTSARKSAEWSR